MQIGTSIILIAVGAILAFAVQLDSTIGGTTVDWNVIGFILMGAGLLGLIISSIWMANAGRRERVERDTVVERERDPYAAR